MTAGVFAWEAILAHLSRNAVVCRGILGTDVMTTGSGPFDEGEFNEMLRECGVSVRNVSDPGPSVLIVGHEDWDAEDVGDQTIPQAKAL